VPVETLKSHGAGSEPGAEARARGGLARTPADWSIAITGIAGPGGGTETKPVGLVYIAVAGRKGFLEVKEYRYGNPGRDPVRTRSAFNSLDMLRRALLA